MDILRRKNRERWLFIVNSTAGRGKTGRKINELMQVLEKHKFDYQIELTKYSKHATKLAKDGIHDGYRKLIAVGGDGTINEVISGIMLSGKSEKVGLGIIPEGGGNDFAKNFHITGDIEEDIKILEEKHASSIDIGKVNDYYFMNALGIGFDAEVAVQSEKIKKLNGLPRYFVALLKILAKLKPYSFQLELDGEKIEKDFLLVSVGNGYCTGGGFLLTPNAKVNDGVFDICLVDAVSKGRLLKVLSTVFKGTHLRFPEVEMRQVKKIKVKSETPIPLYFDGELPTEELKEITIEILPSALKIYNKRHIAY